MEGTGFKFNDRELRRFSKPVLVASRPYPPMGGGSSTIMRNLLEWVEPESLVLAVLKSRTEEGEGNSGFSHRRHFVDSESPLPARMEAYRQYLFRSVLTRRLVALGRGYRCGAVVGVYPGLVFLDAACRAAQCLGVPFFPYLHDTVAESQSAGGYAQYASRVQERVFSSASRVLVATRGMAALFREKYAIEATAVVHVYPDAVPEGVPDSPGSMGLFWSGNVYSINGAALRRVFEASEAIPGLGITFATKMSRENIARHGFVGKRVVRTYIPVQERPQYLRLLGNHDILILSLSWPDESPIHEDELRTIFPTKAPEYLASGRPILVHCPEHYYLAQFFKAHGCGEVVSERNIDSLQFALQSLLQDREKQIRLGEAALRVVSEFYPENVVPVFFDAVEEGFKG